MLEEGYKLVDIDKTTDIVLLIYGTVDCCLLRSQASGKVGWSERRIWTVSEQSVPYTSDLAILSALSSPDGKAYEGARGDFAFVWGSGFCVEEIGVGGPVRVSYVVQVVPEALQLIFADEMIRDMQLHRSHCLVMLKAAAERYKNLQQTQ